MSDILLQSEIIIRKAIEQYKPIKCVLMVSGGHDSITNAHVSASVLSKLGISFEVYHGNTTIGIPETQHYVKQICMLFNWKLTIGIAPKTEDHYAFFVAKWGFPGPTKKSHQIMYRRLKERALNHFVTYQCKKSPFARQNVLLLSGVRQQESKIRMGYKHVTAKERSKIWCNPIFFWSEADCRNYMVANSIPLNPVKQTIGISGECLCGAFASKSEFDLIKQFYPATAEMLEDLHDLAVSNGHNWNWWEGPKPKKIIETKETGTACKVRFMCASCG
jgi:3'-phosphoadenosine 5'-phosphosulfate sulfotransferase (PAPS reductase)/FAD synthetase